MDKAAHGRELRRLGELLRQIREDAGLTQLAVAELLAVPQSFVSKYEAGERRLDVVEFTQVCSALGASPVDLINRFQSA